MAEPSMRGSRDALSRVREVAAHARAFAEGLVGLPIDEARECAKRDGNVELREITRRGQPVTADFRANRITVLVEDGTVVEARGGA